MDKKFDLILGYCGVMGMQATSCTPLAGPVISELTIIYSTLQLWASACLSVCH